jgi:hypothetical protein
MKIVGVIECNNSNLVTWKIIHMSTKGILIPFAKDGTTPTSAIKNQARIRAPICDA